MLKAKLFYFSSFKNPDRIFSRNGICFWKFRFFYCRPYENCAETIFDYAKNALLEKKALNPNFDYTCTYISVLLHQYVLLK